MACETLVATGLVLLAGEITTRAAVDFQRIGKANADDTETHR